MMTLDLFTQIIISAFGLSALGLMQLHTPRRRRWGVILGLCAQPAWYTQLVIHDLWGMLPVFIGYTTVWIFGFLNLWIKPWRKNKCSTSTR